MQALYFLLVDLSSVEKCKLIFKFPFPFLYSLTLFAPNTALLWY